MHAPLFPIIARCIFTALLILPASSWAQSYTLTTVAGGDRLGDGKPATSVALRDPWAAVQDAAGNIYIADRADNRVRRVAPDGVITTVAGTGIAGFTGDNGPAILARLNKPYNVRLDGSGNLFIADYNNQRVRKVVLTTGIITTVAGDGRLPYSGDGVLATQTAIDPVDIAIDSAGDLYIADALNNRIRKVSASDGMIRTIAGIGTAGFAGDTTQAATSAISLPNGVAVDAEKNVYIADTGNNRVRKIATATGIITTLAGSGVLDSTGNGGLAVNAALFYPVSVAVEANGDVLVAGLADVRRINLASATISPVAGGLSIGFLGDGGPANLAVWGLISTATVAPNGDILVTDLGNYRIRRIRSGLVGTVAGVGFQNTTEANKASLSSPAGLALDPTTGGIVFAERSNHVIRGLSGGQVTREFGDGYPTSGLTRLVRPEGVARDAGGVLYIADTDNNRILRSTSASAASVIAGGRGYGFNGATGLSTQIALASPSAVVVAGDGTLYIADTDNCRIRKIVGGQLTTIAGGGRCTYSGDGAQATSAGLVPYDISLDGKGGLLVADGTNNRIRRIDLTTGVISTIAGIGSSGHSGDGGPAALAQISFPRGITANAAGKIFFAEYGTSTVRMIDNGVISTIAGTGQYISTADSGPATAVAFDPVRLVAAADGSVYVSDEFNDRIRKLTLSVPSAIQVLQGANATGEAGGRIPLQVRVVDSVGIAVANVPVRFEVATGSATVSSVSTPTTSAGIAQVQVTLGNTVGPVVINVTTDGVPLQTVTMTVIGASIPLPQISDAAVVGAGLSVPPVRALSTGGIMTAFGSNFGVGATFRKVGNADLVNGKVPTNFAGICVDVAGARSPVFGASDTQVNFQAPAGLSGNVAVKVISGCGTATEKTSNAVTVAAQSASPEFFYFAASATGKNPVAATDTITGALRASPTLFPSSGITAAKPGSYVTVYATGFGDTDPSFTPGDFPSGIGRAKGTVRVLLDGTALPAENVLYAGVTPNSPGLYQLNIQLPANTPAGDLTLVIEIGGVQSPGGAFLTVAP
jgi:uncharacterized protein (TIGR03437 family)